MERILISRTDAIGDVVLTLPLCGALKKYLPKVEVLFLGRTYTKEVIAKSKFVDGFVNADDLLRLPEAEAVAYLKSLKVDAIIHVLRCFEDSDITHVEGSVDPIRDAETVETELMLADLDSLEKRLPALQKKAKGGDKESQFQVDLIEPILKALQDGRMASTAIAPENVEAAKRLQLMTSKPILFVCNVDEGSAATGNAFSARVAERARAMGARHVVVSAAIEAEVSQLPDEDRGEFLEGLGLTDSGLDRVIREGYALLGLVTYFTVGPKEARAWTIVRGTKAPQAAAVIHNDFERGFIACETTAFDDFVAYKGEQGAKEAGKMRVEGKEYVVKDGDILLFRFNV